MKSFRPLTSEEKLMRIEDEINQMENQKLPLIERKRELENRISELNVTLKHSGRVEDEQYNRCLSEKGMVNKEKMEIESLVMKINRDIKNKYSELQKEKISAKKSNVDGIKEYLIELRDKYLSFSADTSRVSSMRAMSSKFVEEINQLIKKIS